MCSSESADKTASPTLLEHDGEKNLKIQKALNTILWLSLAPIPLDAQLLHILELIISRTGSWERPPA